MDLTETNATLILEKGLLGFHSSYHAVNWHHLLTHAQKSLTVVVYYWDQWVHEHKHALVEFFKKPEATVRFFFADDNIPAVLTEIERLFPKHSGIRLREKIRDTHLPLQEAVHTLRLPETKVQVYKLPHVLNYSMQCIDDKILVLSFFEMYRQEQVDSPVIIADLQQSPHLQAFYAKELRGMCARAMSST